MTRDRMPAEPGRGFTLIELLIVMFILSILGLFLVQILQQGVQVVSTGETGRELLERGEVAARAVERDFKRIAGPMKGSEHGRPVSRLVSDWVAAPPPATKGSAADEAAARRRIDWLPRVRATIVLDRHEEEALYRAALRPQAEAVAANAQEAETKLDELVAVQPFTSLGEWVLVAWPAGDPEGAYLEVRSGIRLGGSAIATGTSEVADEKVASVFDDGALDKPEALLTATHLIATGLLHIEFRYWSQFTISGDEPAGKGGPESCWDSARAGLFAERHPVNRFTLDVGVTSLADPLDDVFPARVEIVLVVDRPGEDVVCAILAEAVDADDNELLVDFPERLPYSEASQFVKIGSEWMQYARLDGRRLYGVKRGVRGTSARGHQARERIHGGRTMVITVPLVPRDSWNG